MQPLKNITIVSLEHAVAAPFATRQLADLGARVIKIERPDGGDLTRGLYLSDTEIDGESTVFHAINRGKEIRVRLTREELGGVFEGIDNTKYFKEFQKRYSTLNFKVIDVYLSAKQAKSFG